MVGSALLVLAAMAPLAAANGLQIGQVETTIYNTYLPTPIVTAIPTAAPTGFTPADIERQALVIEGAGDNIRPAAATVLAKAYLGNQDFQDAIGELNNDDDAGPQELVSWLRDHVNELPKAKERQAVRAVLAEIDAVGGAQRRQAATNAIPSGEGLATVHNTWFSAPITTIVSTALPTGTSSADVALAALVLEGQGDNINPAVASVLAAADLTNNDFKAGEDQIVRDSGFDLDSDGPVSLVNLLADHVADVTNSAAHLAVSTVVDAFKSAGGNAGGPVTISGTATATSSAVNAACTGFSNSFQETLCNLENNQGLAAPAASILAGLPSNDQFFSDLQAIASITDDGQSFTATALDEARGIITAIPELESWATHLPKGEQAHFSSILEALDAAQASSAPSTLTSTMVSTFTISNGKGATTFTSSVVSASPAPGNGGAAAPPAQPIDLPTSSVSARSSGVAAPTGSVSFSSSAPKPTIALGAGSRPEVMTGAMLAVVAGAALML